MTAIIGVITDFNVYHHVDKEISIKKKISDKYYLLNLF